MQQVALLCSGADSHHNPHNICCAGIRGYDKPCDIKPGHPSCSRLAAVHCSMSDTQATRALPDQAVVASAGFRRPLKRHSRASHGPNKSSS